MKDEGPRVQLVNRPGRPKAAVPKTMVSAWVPVSLHAALVKKALADGNKSVSETVLGILARKMP